MFYGSKVRDNSANVFALFGIYFGLNVIIFGVGITERFFTFANNQEVDHMMPPVFVSRKSDELLRFFQKDMPQRNEFTGLVFVLAVAGHATVEIDGRPYQLQRGKLLTLLPSHLVQTTDIKQDFRYFTLAFLFDSMSEFPYMVQSSLTEKMGCSPLIPVQQSDYHRLKNCFEMLEVHYERKGHPSYAEILRSLIFVFTAEVSAIYSNKPMKSAATHDKELTDAFFKLLHKHFRTVRESSFYADQLCVSTKQLSRIVCLVTGHASSYWISNFTIREAKILLKSTSLTVTQISEQLNFPNSSFFARYFRRHTSLSPREFRG